MEKSNPRPALHDPVYVIFQQLHCRHLLPAAALGLRRTSCHQKHLNTDLRQAGLMPSMSSKTRAFLHSRHPPDSPVNNQADGTGYAGRGALLTTECVNDFRFIVFQTMNSALYN